jgi:pimeloyl-ACP methyl ester carboxylesterase
MIAFALSGLAFGLLAVWIAGGWMMRPRATAVPAAHGSARDFHMLTQDGVTLDATYRASAGPRAPAVLLLHGVGASREAVAPMAAWLAKQGYATLSIDFRGHGESTARPRSFGWHEAGDAHAAFSWLRRRHPGARIAVIGISMGGAASLIGPRGPLPADGLILQAVYPDIRHAIRNRMVSRLGSWPAAVMEPLLSLQAWPRIGVWPDAIAPVRAISRFQAPVMVIGGAEDVYTPPEETRVLYDAAPSKRVLWIVANGDHAKISSLSDDVYRAKVLRFLADTIGAASAFDG